MSVSRWVEIRKNMESVPPGDLDWIRDRLVELDSAHRTIAAMRLVFARIESDAGDWAERNGQ